MAKRGRKPKIIEIEEKQPEIEEKEPENDENTPTEDEIWSERELDNAKKARVWLAAEKMYRYHNEKYSPSIRMIHNCKRWARLGIEYMSGAKDRTGSPKIYPVDEIEKAVAKERNLCISVLPDDERAVYELADERFAEAERKKAERIANEQKREAAKSKERAARTSNRATSTGGAGLDLPICDMPDGGVPVVHEDVQGDSGEESEVDGGDMPDLQYEVN